MVRRIVSHSKITSTKTISLGKEVADVLEVNRGDEILYILNKNGIVNIRKFKGDVILGPGEKYLYSGSVFYSNKESGFVVSIASEVRQTIDVDIGDDVLWIIDNDKNIIIRHAFLSNICSIDMINKNISALVIDVATLSTMYKTSLPKDVIDILGIEKGTTFTLSTDKYNNVIASREEISNNLLQIAKPTFNQYGAEFYIYENVRNMLDITINDKILWIIDEDGNMIIRNAILSDNCI